MTQIISVVLEIQSRKLWSEWILICVLLEGKIAISDVFQGNSSNNIKTACCCILCTIIISWSILLDCYIKVAQSSQLPSNKKLLYCVSVSETPVPIQFTPFLGILAGAVVTLLGTSCHIVTIIILLKIKIAHLTLLAKLSNMTVKISLTILHLVDHI